MIIRITTILFLALLITSCQPKDSNSSDSNIDDNTEVTASVSNKALDQKSETIDANEEKWSVANSLTYRHNNGSHEEVLAYLDENQKIVKVEEKFNDALVGNSGTRTYYLENGIRFKSVERFIDNKESKGAFKERISYYKNNEVISTIARLTQFEENLQKETFKTAPNYDCSMARAEEVLNQKGVFSTTFQGFLENGNLTFLLVGGPGETGYTSAVAVQHADNLINTLRNNEAASINKPLEVTFDRMVDEKNMEFQVLVKAQAVK